MVEHCQRPTTSRKRDVVEGGKKGLKGRHESISLPCPRVLQGPGKVTWLHMTAMVNEGLDRRCTIMERMVAQPSFGGRSHAGECGWKTSIYTQRRRRRQFLVTIAFSSRASDLRRLLADAGLSSRGFRSKQNGRRPHCRRKRRTMRNGEGMTRSNAGPQLICDLNSISRRHWHCNSR